MKAEIVKTCSVICEPGSIVEISEGQYKALGDFAVSIDKAVKDEPETEKKPKRAKKG